MVQRRRRRDATAETATGSEIGISVTTSLAVQLPTTLSLDFLADVDCTFKKSTVDSNDATVLYDDGVTAVGSFAE